MAGIVDDLYIQANKDVSTTAVELVVASSPDPDRTIVRIYNKGDETIYIGPENTVTASGVNQGEPLFKDQWIAFSLHPNLTVWGITASGTSTVLIQELTNADF
jgi:hypothetical protein